jgi:cell cycle checkpoint protein
MSDFDDDLNLDDFAFAKPLPPKRHSTQLLAVNKSSKGSLWSEKHSPKSANQLAVHPKKIEEVKSWLLKQNNSSRRPGIVIITGPPGCGKTATVQTLANDMAIHVQEWVNPNEHVEYVARDDFMFNDSIPYVSQTAAFRTFMLRANRYNVLGKNGGKIILLEELPSFAFRNTSDFHNILRCYKRQFPVIIIQSETSGKDDRIRTLFPPDFLTELGVDQIHFNPVAPTNLVKALSAIVQAERASGQFQVPDKAVLTSLASSVNGDVRGAINALQFACLKGFSIIFFSITSLF